MAPAENKPFSWSILIFPRPLARSYYSLPSPASSSSSSESAHNLEPLEIKKPADATFSPNNDSLESHSIPGVPKTPSTRLKDAPSRRPTSRSKKDPNHVPRPLNAFFLFRRAFLNEKRGLNSSDLPFYPSEPEEKQTDISVLAGKKWKTLSHSEKETYKTQAKILKAEHEAKHPDYQYRPSPKTSRDRNRKTSVKGLKKKSIPRKNARALGSKGIEYLLRLGQAHHEVQTFGTPGAPVFDQPTPASSPSSSSNASSFDFPTATSHFSNPSTFVPVHAPQGQSSEDALIKHFHRFHLGYERTPDYRPTCDSSDTPHIVTHCTVYNDQWRPSSVDPAAQIFVHSQPELDWTGRALPVLDIPHTDDANSTLLANSNQIQPMDPQPSFPAYSETTTCPSLISEPPTIDVTNEPYPLELSHFDPNSTNHLQFEHAQLEPLNTQTQAFDVGYYNYDAPMSPQMTFRIEDVSRDSQSWLCWASPDELGTYANGDANADVLGRNQAPTFELAAVDVPGWGVMDGIGSVDGCAF